MLNAIGSGEGIILDVHQCTYPQYMHASVDEAHECRMIDGRKKSIYELPSFSDAYIFNAV